MKKVFRRFTGAALAMLLIGIPAAAVLNGCARPSIREAKANDHDFYLRSLSSVKTVFRLEVWSHDREIRLWELGLRDRNRPLMKGAIRYGRTPTTMERVFPPGESSPVKPRPGETIIVRIRFHDDQFLAPSSSSHTLAFRVEKDGRWIIRSLPPRARKPIWSSTAGREQFIASIKSELAGPRRALFMRDAKAGSERARTIAILKQYSGETDLRRAYIYLRRQRSLNLTSLKLKDISVLADFKNVRKLYLSRNNIIDISSLRALRNLEILSLGDNPIKDPSPLAALRDLTLLELNGTGIRTLEFVRGLRKLATLGVADNCLRDLNPLAELKQPYSLDLGGNRIEDVEPLVKLYRSVVQDSSAVGPGQGEAFLVILRGNPLKNADLLRKPWMKKVRIIYPGFGENPPGPSERPAPKCSP